MIWQPSQVKALRIIAKLSQQHLADLCGVGQPMIAHTESGYRQAAKHLGASLTLVRRLMNISLGEIDAEIASSPYLTRHDPIKTEED
jgi:transcriptional regulator with XRE-family HTH domain